ncbi:DUF6414 family protein [Lactobacillus gigeriorum]|uniref:Uncharacterized protein n=1 Tax=Lactobacillus gigeriorum DSM 23908 = CRBIP 24.85 TaxID=1423751 RepID=I7KPY8_9LACO|nr:hypothetical protein [Lactobacillus gigeriorum]KRN09806.1 hypothetical protein FC38_GL001275 [Lactobacillus gigeriorum DSM 23908 = CRBIP 24.85]CCI87614.1 Putative uncharacterized protein [Lactobacillus gigeriorum DSM 23908 = CRBIP 24.85]
MENKTIKEYIYLDEQELNSILAQFENGIPQVIQSLIQESKGSSNSDKQIKSKNANIGVSAGFHGDISETSSDEAGSSNSNVHMTQEAITTVYNDYAIDIVTKELDSSKLLKTTTKQEEGAFVELCSKFTIIDPVSMGQKDDLASLMDLAKSVSDNNKPNESDEGSIDIFAKVNTVFNTLFPKTTLIKTNNALTIADSDMFRINKTQLKFLSFSKNRKITILGRVQTKLEEKDFDFPENTNISEILPRLGLIALQSLDLLKTNDAIIRPIAIYFE